MDYHVLTNNKQATLWRVVFHLPVPAVDNSAGYPMQSVIAARNPKDADGNGTTAAVYKLQADKDAAQLLLDSGEIMEVQSTVEVGKDNSNSEKIEAVEAEYTRHLNETRQAVLDTHDQYGREGTVSP